MLVQSHWSYWLISKNLRTVCTRLQRAWLGQLAVSLSPAEPRICRFCMCGSLNSACTWLIEEICRQVFFCNCQLEWDSQRLQIHQKQKWSMESFCSCFHVQMHKPLVHDSPRASIYHQGTEEFRDSPNTTDWPQLVFEGLGTMDQLSKSRTKHNLQAKYRTLQMPLAAGHWLSEGSKS